VQNMECLFGKIVVGPNNDYVKIQLNDAGTMVYNEWLDIPNRFPQIQLHAFIVMPNHFHAIMEIVGASLVGAQNREGAQNNSGAPNQGRPQGITPTDCNGAGYDETVGDVVGAFKS